MAKSITQYSIFLSSTSNLSEERLIAEEVVKELNSGLLSSIGAQLRLIKWETDIHPDVGAYAQDVINNQINDEYDIFIGMLFDRFGTPTLRAGSGTEEEFDRAYNRYLVEGNSVKILFYFSERNINISKVDIDELIKLRNFQEKLQNLGVLYWKYSDINSFSRDLRLHLFKCVEELNLQSTQKVEAVSSQLVVDFENNDEVEEEQNDLGWLEYFELAGQSRATSMAYLEDITNVVKTLGVKMNLRTAEINEASKNKNLPQAEIAKLIDSSAKDIMNFGRDLEILTPKFKENAISTIEYFSKGFDSYDEFNRDEEDIFERVKNLNSLSENISESTVSLIQMKDAIDRLPKVMKSVNVAKNKAVNNLNKLLAALNEYKSAVDTLSQKYS